MTFSHSHGCLLRHFNPLLPLIFIGPLFPLNLFNVCLIRVIEFSLACHWKKKKENLKKEKNGDAQEEGQLNRGEPI